MTTRNVIVTGGSRGIGRAVVERLLTDGLTVVTCGRSGRPANLPAGADWVTADVAAPDDARRLVAHAVERYGPVSVLVNNAGVQIEKTVPESTDDDWDLLVGANCRGVFNLCRAVLPGMQQHGGVILNIGSISGVVADRSMALYNASKGFVHALTRSIAVDHGPAVRCNAILPGWIATEMAAEAFALSADSEAAHEDAVRRHPAGRLGTPEDIAEAVAWLASDRAAFVTGQTLTVDGGLTASSPIQPLP